MPSSQQPGQATDQKAYETRATDCEKAAKTEAVVAPAKQQQHVVVETVLQAQEVEEEDEWITANPKSKKVCFSF